MRARKRFSAGATVDGFLVSFERFNQPFCLAVAPTPASLADPFRVSVALSSPETSQLGGICADYGSLSLRSQ